MLPPIRPVWDADTRLILSRDVRIRRDDNTWGVHFRSNAPIQYGLVLSEEAFQLLVSFGSGEIPQKASRGLPKRLAMAMIDRFVEPGLLLSTRYEIHGRTVKLSPRELLALRKSVPIDTVGLLELEAVLLYLLARENRSRAPICELGSQFGGSTITLAKGAEQSRHGNRVLAVDDHEWHRHVAVQASTKEWAARIPSTLTAFRKNVRKAGVSSQVKLVLADTAAAAAQIKGTVSVLFIDASHGHDDVKRDFDAWYPKLEPSGTVIFHDYGNPLWPGVKRAVDQIQSSLNGWAVYQTLLIGTKA